MRDGSQPSWRRLLLVHLFGFQKHPSSHQFVCVLKTFAKLMTTQRTFQNRACDLKPHNGPLCCIFATENHESESNPLINSTKILAFFLKKLLQRITHPDGREKHLKPPLNKTVKPDLTVFSCHKCLMSSRQMYSTGHFLCLYSTVPFTWGETLTVTTNQMLVSFGCGCEVPRETKQAIMREIQFEGLSTLLDETLAVPLFHNCGRHMKTVCRAHTVDFPTTML